MSFQDQFISNMFDPTNRMITRMVDTEALNARNAGQQALAQGSVAQQALWTYDSAGRLVMRDIDEAVSIAQGIAAMNATKAQPSAQPDISNADLAKAIMALANKIEAWTTVQA